MVTYKNTHSLQDMTSDGLFSEYKCYHWYESVSSFIVETLLLTNDFTKYGDFLIHAKEIMKSVKRTIFSVWKFSDDEISGISLSNKIPEHNFNGGIDSALMGVILDLLHTVWAVRDQMAGNEHTSRL